MELCQKRVEVGDLRVSIDPTEVIVTYALGSCVGVVVHDPVAGVGGLAHVQLPGPGVPGSDDVLGAWAYADRAIPELLRRAWSVGATRHDLKVALVGGAIINDPHNYFQIGRKTYLAVKRALWQERVLTNREDVGGESWRTVRLEVGSGRIIVETSEGRREL